MKIAFAGTPEFARVQLQALLDNGFEVVVVYTQPDKPAGRGRHLHESPVKLLAQEYHLPIEQPATLKSTEAQATLASYQVDVMIVAAYGLILPKAILQTPRLGCINVHASLLPKYRGAAPIQSAILAGEEITGITLMQMDEGLDTGNMLATAIQPINHNETVTSLHDKLAVLGATLLSKKLFEILDSPKPIVQQENAATYASKITKAQAQINWALSAQTLDRQIRAYHAWPVSFSYLNGQCIRIWQSEPLSKLSNALAGTIIDTHAKGIEVATGNGVLLITQLQLPSKKITNAFDLLHSHNDLFKPGNRFIEC